MILIIFQISCFKRQAAIHIPSYSLACLNYQKTAGSCFKGSDFLIQGLEFSPLYFIFIMQNSQVIHSLQSLRNYCRCHSIKYLWGNFPTHCKSVHLKKKISTVLYKKIKMKRQQQKPQQRYSLLTPHWQVTQGDSVFSAGPSTLEERS